MKEEISFVERGDEEKDKILETAKKNSAFWLNTLLSKNEKEMASLYADDNTFLPTISPDFKKGALGAEEYFKHFLEKNPKGMIVEDAVQPLDEKKYLHSGMYDFEVDSNGKREIVHARFSFVWRKESNGDWKIIHHHSSIRPQ
jgi:uncharacterized protein (TIGR02246 family)